MTDTENNNHLKFYDLNLVRHIFGEVDAGFFDIAQPILRELGAQPVHYRFMDPEEYKELFERKPTEANAVYVTELLYRAHLAAAASLLRSFRWIEGLLIAYKSRLFLPYCASARGFTEAVADAAYSLHGIYYDFARLSRHFERALLHTSESFVMSTELEAKLVHFTEAGRLEKRERMQLDALSLKWRKAEEVKTYFTHAFEGASPGGFYEFYQLLCEFVHPAARSVKIMLEPKGGKLRLMANRDHEALDALVLGNVERMGAMLRIQVIFTQVMMAVLNRFPLKTLHTRAIDESALIGYHAWGRCLDAYSGPE